VFPNPVKDMLNVQFEKGVEHGNTLEIFSVSGDFEKAIVLNSETLQKIPVGDLTSGMYFLRITNNGRITNEKIVKE